MLRSIKLMKNWEIAFPILLDLFTWLGFLFILGIYMALLQIPLFTFLTDLIQNQASPELRKIIIYTLIFHLLIYLYITVMQSLSWYWTYKLTGRKTTVRQLLKRFAKYNLLWVLLIGSINAISKILQILDGLARNELINTTILSYIIYILYFVVLYFILASYSGYKIKIAFKRIRSMIHPYLVIVGILLILNILMSYPGQYSVYLLLASGIFILLPFISWAKIYFMDSIRKI